MDVLSTDSTNQEQRARITAVVRQPVETGPDVTALQASVF
jgi:hypothetical protein